MTVPAPVPVRAISPPRMLPLGTSQPPGDKYVCLDSIISFSVRTTHTNGIHDQAISVSLPTWDSVPGRPLGYQWVIEKMEANYPR
jgi:hypothetical protein